jgi:hypothetical protein
MLGAPLTHSGTAPLAALATCIDRFRASGVLDAETLQDGPRSP